MQGQLANCVKTSTGAGKVEDDSSTVTVPIGIFVSGNGESYRTVCGCIDSIARLKSDLYYIYMFSMEYISNN